ncbi:hypothetical protein PFISCL1PPCAC_17325, partial [Pristionchus fissidentatus]
MRRAAAHKEELAAREDELAHRLQAPSIPKGINVIATRSEPFMRPAMQQMQQMQPAVAAQEMQPRPVSYVSEASAILSAPSPAQIRPVSLVLPPVAPQPAEPPVARPISMFSPPPPSSLLRVNSSPVPFGRTFVDSATSPNPPPAYDPATWPAALQAAVAAASAPPLPRTHKRVDISKQPPKKTTNKKKVNGGTIVPKKAKKAEIFEVHPAPLTGVAPTQLLHKGNIIRSPSPAPPAGSWAAVAEVLDEADLGTEPRRSPEDALEAPPSPAPPTRYDPREDMARVHRPVYLPLDFENSANPTPPPRIALDLVDDYEDSIVSSTFLRPEMRRILRIEDDCESQETNEDWRKANLSLLDEEGQWERDLATVGELNRRMRESTDRDPCDGDDDSASAMDEEDRRRAIESIERHQRTLERQQASLSVLLDSAIVFLRGLDAAPPPAPVGATPLPPPRAAIPTATVSAVTAAAAAAQA